MNHLKTKFKYLIVWVFFNVITSCGVVDEYNKPIIELPANYNSYTDLQTPNVEWKTSSNTADSYDNDKWWEIYDDPLLNELEEHLNSNNLDIAIAVSQYAQARALVDKARSSYLPSFNISTSVSKQKSASSNGLTTKDNLEYLRTLTTGASWEIDLWNNIGYSIDAANASAESLKAQMDLAVLSAQTSLAQYYFEYCIADRSQQILNKIVNANEELLAFTKNRFKAGIDSQVLIEQIESQLKISQTAVLNNTNNINLYKNAIQTLINPQDFNIESNNCILPSKSIDIPLGIPSQLLERRPDIAQAEQNIKLANAELGIASSAYFPSLILSASKTFQSTGLKHFLSLPTYIWSVGPQLALTLFQPMAINASITAAEEGYNAIVASYKKVVVDAFYGVENNLSSLESFKNQNQLLNGVILNQSNQLNIINNQYKVGIVDYSAVLNAQISNYNAQINSYNINILRMSSEIGLIKALGGIWKESKPDKD